MAVYRRGGTWWYKFHWRGEAIRESTKQTNKRVAEQIEAARRGALAKGEVGIRDVLTVPTLQHFGTRFMEAIETRCGEKPRTVVFYRGMFNRLLDYGPLAGARLDDIDEALIEGFVQDRRRVFALATVNRQLATLRRALRLACEWKVIPRVPRVRLLPGERVREFVLSREQERLYLAAAPQPLHDVALLILESGLRVGEALNLEWPDIHFEPAGGAKLGYLHVREGKSKHAKRNLSLTARASEMLTTQKAAATSLCVFGRESGGPWLVTSLSHQHQRLRALLKLPKDFVIHSLRHTMLTRLGEAGVDAFAIMRIAGHSTITVSQRYVHPTPEALERAFEKLEALSRVQEVGTDLGTVAQGAGSQVDAKVLN
jgi:integrase